MRELIETVSSLVWGMPTVFLLLGTGVYLLCRLGGLFFRVLRLVPSVLRGRKGEGGAPFEVFSTVLAGTVGTGNIVGVAAAVLTGGPGAVFWMWVSAFLGMVTNFSEVVLGQRYRRKNTDGTFTGGAFVTIADGLHAKKLGLFTAFVTVLASFGMSGAQVSQITGTLWETGGSTVTTNPLFFRLAAGGSLAVFVGYFLFGHKNRVGRVTAKLLPAMSLLFLVLAFAALFRRAGRIPEAFGLIFSSAFGRRAAVGGVGGYTLSTVMSRGLARGVFSNEAGLGSSVIAHTDSSLSEPVEQGAWGVFAVFCDTVVICTLSALMLLVTLPYPFPAGTDTSLAVRMFSDNFGVFGRLSFAVLLLLFGSGALITWSYYGRKAAAFCYKKSDRAFALLYILFLPLAAVFDTSFAWTLSDLCNGLMVLPNLLCLLLLGRQVKEITDNYFLRKRFSPNKKDR